jgi:hypothetical protein
MPEYNTIQYNTNTNTNTNTHGNLRAGLGGMD